MTQLDASARENLEPIQDVSELAAYLATGCKPKEDWRIGTEHEKFGFLWDTLEPLPFDGERSIQAILEGLHERFGWSRLEENGELVALKKDGASITLEPGGQFELSGAPLRTIQETCNEVHTHLDEVKAVTDPLGIGFIGLGATPTWTREQMPKVPKGRYTIMRRYMPKVGDLGLDMMHRTATVQVNLDYSSEEDMVKKFRTSLALQPIATALFANSPLTEGKPNGFRSWRSHIWTDTDADRTGMLDFVFDDDFGFERYTQYMLDVPMYFVWRDGEYFDATGLSFRDFLDGKLEAAPGQKPTIEDWKDHLSTAFPEVRLKTFLEMRGADSGTWGRICALPALWVGLLYDQASLDEAYAMIEGWSGETHNALRAVAAKDGMTGEVGPINIQQTAIKMIDLARDGLRRRAELDQGGTDETGFLNPLAEIARKGESFACQFLREYEEGAGMKELFKRYAF